jgi:hypothetical protein
MGMITQTMVFTTETKTGIFASPSYSILREAFPNDRIEETYFPLLSFPKIPSDGFLKIYPDEIKANYLKHPLSLVIG